MSGIKRVGKFEKVSFEQFKKDWLATFPNCCDGEEDGDSVESIDSIIRSIYDDIKLPRRATRGSAGYDFFAPIGFDLNDGQSIKIPSGIRCIIVEGWWLAELPRSGHGFKFRLQLDNTVGVIDQDYSESDNEGHIFLKLTKDSHNGIPLKIRKGEGMAQAIFTVFGITVDDDVTEQRNGGFGSTTNQQMKHLH